MRTVRGAFPAASSVTSSNIEYTTSHTTLVAAFKNADVGQLELVKEALAERAHMLKAAPYMNTALPIMIPMYCKTWYDPLFIPYYMAGVKVYDFVAKLHGESGVPNSHFIDKEEAKFQFPMINEKDLWGAIVYYDGQMNDSR